MLTLSAYPPSHSTNPTARLAPQLSVMSLGGRPTVAVKPQMGFGSLPPFTPNELESIANFIGPLAQGEKILDLGAGLSGLAEHLAQSNPEVKVIALDADLAVISELEKRKQNNERLTNLHTVQADMTTALPPFLQYAFDAIMKLKQLMRRMGRWIGLMPPPDVSTPPRLTGQRQGIPLMAKSLDKVIMTRIAPENNIERQGLMWQVSRLLKPGGELIIVGTQAPNGITDTQWRAPAKWLSILASMSGYEITADTKMTCGYYGIKASNP